MITEWGLFRKENGKVGILALDVCRRSKRPLIEFKGTFDEACKKAEEIEREEVKDVR